MPHIRPPAVAGLFYPNDPDELRGAVLALLKESRSIPSQSWPKAIIAPHAGYIYSGPVAASAYSGVSSARGHVRRVVVLGPAHQAYVRALALPEAEAFSTPLGVIPLDLEAMRALESLPQISRSETAHRLEHSIETQLPFLQESLGEFKLIPLVVGDASPEEVAEVLERIWGGEETLIVVSSDLSHYLSDTLARAADEKTVNSIVAMDSRIGAAQACGAASINGLLLTARSRGLHPVPLDVRNSSQIAGGPDRVVGYAALAFEPDTPIASASDDKGAILLPLARSAISSALGMQTPHPESAPWLSGPGASFVTLSIGGELRGCIGSLEAYRPLEADVRDNALSAAFRDPRFFPLSRKELELSRMEVSLLSSPELLLPADEADAVASLRPRVDGIIFEYGFARSTFLPQVWDQLPDPSDFLGQLKRKAGLSCDFWADGIRLWRYEVAKWKEAL